MKLGNINLSQKIDVRRQTIELASISSTNVEQVSSVISDSDPRYSFYRYIDKHEGQEQAAIIFIYTCPSLSKIKERMIYASSRAGVIAATEKQTGLHVVKKVRSTRERLPLELTYSRSS